jgi:hypothetical protein
VEVPCAQGEKQHEHVLAAGNPRHRLDTIRSDREEETTDRGGERRYAEPLHEPKQQANRSEVQYEVVQAVCRGARGPERAVNHVGNQVKGLVALESQAAESVGEVGSGKGLNIWVVNYNPVVVPVEKFTVEGQRHRGKRHRNRNGSGNHPWFRQG